MRYSNQIISYFYVKWTNIRRFGKLNNFNFSSCLLVMLSIIGDRYFSTMVLMGVNRDLDGELPSQYIASRSS